MFYPAGGQQYTLGSSISSTQTTILLSSFTEPVTGTPYTMALLNTDIAYGTIAPKTSQSEFISFTGITQNANGTATLTGVTRGLAKKYPFTTSGSYKLPHSGGSIFILSDVPQLFEKYISIENDVTITGVKTFTNPDYPRMDTATPAPTDDEQLVPKKYVDDAVISGGVPATTTVLGIVKMSVAPADPASPIAVGDNDTRVPTQSENDALQGTSGNPSSTNKYVTQNDTSNAATITGTTIAFVNSNPDTITDSGNGFVTAGFQAGQTITVTGSTSNNNTFTIASVAAGTLTLVAGDSLTAESAGASVTITAATIGKVVRYSSSSQVKVPTTPVDNNDAASKAYTQSAISSAISAVVPAFSKVTTNTVTNVSVPVTTLTKITEWTGLTGNTQDIFTIEFELGSNIQLGSSALIYLRLNDDATTNNYQYAYTLITSSGAGSLSNLSGTGDQMYLLNGSSNGELQTILGSVKIKASRTISGTTRVVLYDIIGGLPGSTKSTRSMGSGTWGDTTNELTSIQIYLYHNAGGGTATINGKATLYVINR